MRLASRSMLIPTYDEPTLRPSARQLVALTDSVEARGIVFQEAPDGSFERIDCAGLCLLEHSGS